MALVDADLKFIAISTGSYGRNSDGGIFSRSSLGKRFIDGNFNFPPRAPIPGYENSGPLPYVAVGDEAFPLLHHLMGRAWYGMEWKMEWNGTEISVWNMEDATMEWKAIFHTSILDFVHCIYKKIHTDVG